MAVVSARNGQTLKSEFDSRKRDEARARNRDDAENELTPDEMDKLRILRYCSKLFDDARKAREPFETFDKAWALFNGDMWAERRPPWRASITINKIRAFITFMQAVMTDNKPRISVEPLIPGSEDAADLLRKLVDRDWDENNMQDELSLFVLFGLIWGTGFMKLTFDPFADGGRGKHNVAVIPPYRIFTNRTATCIEDCEYIIHCEEVTMGWIRRNFPKKAYAVNKVRGIRPGTGERDDRRNRDFIREGDINEQQRIVSAQNVDGNIVQPQFTMANAMYHDDDGDTVEVKEYWLRDDTLEDYQRQVVEKGVGKTQPVIENGEVVMDVIGHKLVVSEIDGQPTMVPIRRPRMEPVMETAWRRKFPNGRLVVIAADRILLRDIPNPFQTDGFPFAMWKDYNVGGFHGQGEPLQLQSCAIAINHIASQVFEILARTANPSFLLKKGGGVNEKSIKNKPGLLIPVEDMDSIKPLEKPPIPQSFFELFKLISDGMGEVSGVGEAIRGAMPAPNTSAQAVDQLTESSAAPIRLKVRNLERGITRMGKLRIQLIQQFDRGERPLRIKSDSISQDDSIVPPASEVAAQFRKYQPADIQGQVEFGVVPISSLSTSPAGVWNRWLTMLDKKLIDRRWFMDKFRIEGFKSELPRLERQEQLDKQMEAAAKDKSKPGPAPKKPARAAHRATRPQPSNLPTPADMAHAR